MVVDVQFCEYAKGYWMVQFIFYLFVFWAVLGLSYSTQSV